jgi:hypothetical protein
MTVFPELYYTSKERLHSGLCNASTVLVSLSTLTFVVLFFLLVDFLYKNGVLGTFFDVLISPVVVPARVATSIVGGEIGVYGFGIAVGIMSLFFYSILLYFILFHWWIKSAMSGKDIAYCLWKSGRALAFTLLVWVAVLWSVNFWMELFVSRNFEELRHITNYGANVFGFSLFFALFGVMSAIVWFFVTFKDLSMQVEGSYYRRVLGIIFGIQLIGGFGNISSVWNGTIGQDYFLAAIGFVMSVGLLAWWNGCDQAYLIAKAQKEQTAQDKKFAINMPEVEIPASERKYCSLKGVGFATCFVVGAVLIVFILMFVSSLKPDEEIIVKEVVQEVNVSQDTNAINHFDWVASNAKSIGSSVILPMSYSWKIGLQTGEILDLPAPFGENTAGWFIGLWLVFIVFGACVSLLVAIFSRDPEEFIKTIKFFGITWLSVIPIALIVVYIVTLWGESFLSLRDTEYLANIQYHHSGLILLCFYVTLVLFATPIMFLIATCPEKYHNYWTFTTRAASMPIFAIFLGFMTTQTVNAWATWFMFSLALIISGFVSGYVYGNGMPSALVENKE